MKYVIIHYNTPELTTALLGSLLKNGISSNIIIFENSNKRLLNAGELFNYELLDNSKGQLIDFNLKIKLLNNLNKISLERIKLEQNASNFGTIKHSMTVQWLIENLNEDFILLDSDILIKKDFRKIIDNTKLFVGMATQYRVLPFLLYLNAPLLNLNNIKFFDGINIFPYKGTADMDTGGSFYKECKKSNKEFTELDLSDFFVHYGSGSWRKNEHPKKWFQGNYKNNSPMEFLSKNKTLFM